MAPTTMMFTRRRMESVRSTGSTTPADELTSWLPDDVCVTCHAQVLAGQLYCSQECREEDAKASAAESSRAAGTSTNEAMPSSAPVISHNQAVKPTRVASGEAISSSSRQVSQKFTGSKAEPASQPEEKFRYPCPPSPNILARYGAHLTSPALAALDHRSSQLQQSSTSEREFASSSSEESANEAHVEQTTTKRRSSSRSTFSSASEAAFSTDPSTPSPAVRSTRDELDDLEPTDLDLPPPMQPATSLMLNARERRSPATKKVNLPSNPPVVKRERVTMMSFARRPSRTNLPAPVLFTSPVLATTVMKASPQTNASAAGLSSSPSGQSSRIPSHGSNAASLPSNHLEEKTSPQRFSPTSMMKRSSVSAMPVNKVHTDTNLIRKSPPSPPQMASASSSAGKTLRATSPAPYMVSTTMSSLKSTTPDNITCGRFGCKGLSGSVEDGCKSSHETAHSSERPSMLLSHKHTHSASAGLNLIGQEGEEGKEPVNATATGTSKLRMTPMLKSSNSVITDGKEERLEEMERSIKSPPRGRSKARGRSSTSRRSPSPPRGAARRGRSEDMLSSKEMSRSSNQSHPVKVPSTTKSPRTSDEAMNNDADDEQEERRGRRGRSPTERRGLPSTKATIKGVDAALSKLRIDEANANAKRAPPSIDTPGSISEVSVSSSTGYDEVDMDEL
ncbi:uncharacterized protein FA14DRAFT_176979 [Meira miltonrushii]|uniref:Uncharacterized protein n=1 Tax=Meira miltonrushii TaxID=1280837 RepID=A0A316VMR7_9BASI|nr:uncharacterized protein FA14DRAFT_176979 [Meira miltonrushii]PWN37693.1 hypothetical protein FA14DRAFT_176979 [Meira miltonrushii]